MIDPSKLPSRIRNWACELYRLGRIHKSREKVLVDIGLAQIEGGRAYLKPHVWLMIKDMHK